MHCMNRLGNLKVESRHSIFDHARGKKKSVLQNTGGLNPQLHLLNYDFKKHNIMKKKTFSFCAYFLILCIILHVLSKKKNFFCTNMENLPSISLLGFVPDIQVLQ